MADHLNVSSTRLVETSSALSGGEEEACASAAATAAAAAAQSSTPSSCETMLWEGWTSQLPNSTITVGDDASTAFAQLPELAASSSSSSSSSRLSGFHHQSDMLATMLAHFHPLAPNSVDSSDVEQSPASLNFFHDQSTSAESSEGTPNFFGVAKSMHHQHLMVGSVPCPIPPTSKREVLIDKAHLANSKSTSHPGMSTTPPLQMYWHSPPGPSSPSSPLALYHNNAAKWSEWPARKSMSSPILSLHDDIMADQTSPQDDHQQGKKLELFPVHQLDDHADHHHTSSWLFPPNTAHSEIHHVNNFTAATWTSSTPPEAARDLLVDQADHQANYRPSCPRTQQLMHFVRVAQEQRSSSDCSYPGDSLPSPTCSNYGKYTYPMPSSVSKRTGKHRVDQLVDSSGPSSKRPHLQAVDHGAGLWRTDAGHGHHQSAAPAVSQAMEIFAIGPALNTNGKPRARRGSATDPQSLYARHRREKINERLKTLQHLVPNGAKVDIVTMLDEAVQYVQFLQLQVKLLKSEKYWVDATPNKYKGIDLTNLHSQTQGSLGLRA